MATVFNEYGFQGFSMVDDDYLLAKCLQDEEWSANNAENETYERDMVFALQLQDYLNGKGEDQNIKHDIFVIKGKRYSSLVDPELETADPTPDVWHLFRDFDQHFFNSVLARNGVLLEWSKKMTSCAGVCQWSSGQCSIRLSFPLLTLRKRSDLIETLLHEMIHAFLFVTRARDDGSHGTKFHEHMYRINKEAKTSISVYHSFHDEVRHYQQHIWRCDGPCRNRGPYFGYIRRVNNRAPGPSDFWWNSHQSSCTGKFVKISEPKGSDTHQKSKRQQSSANQPKIESFLVKKRTSKSNGPTEKNASFVPFSGLGHTLGSKKSENLIPVKTKPSKFPSGRSFFLGTPPDKNNQVQTVVAAEVELNDSKSSSTEDDDILLTSFYQNTDDDEFIKSVNLEDQSVNHNRNNSTPSLHCVPEKKHEIEVLQID